MKQKYLISMSPETQKLSIREYAELEKGEFAFVCEENHDIDDCRSAMENGIESLVAVVRRPNMYPRQDFGEKIAQGIIGLLNDEAGETVCEILIDEREDFMAEKEDIDPKVVYEEDAVEVAADTEEKSAKDESKTEKE